MNEVQVDAPALAAEADAVLAQATPAMDVASGEGGPDNRQTGDAPVNAGASWAPIVDGGMPLLTLVAVPQWNLTERERTEMRESLAQCLDQLFPGGLEGKYACWVRLIAACAGIAGSRYLTLGHLPPFGPKRAEPKKNGDAEARPPS